MAPMLSVGDFINSKNPFEYQGLSAFQKIGMNHINDTQSNYTAQPITRHHFVMLKPTIIKLLLKLTFLTL